MSKRRNLPKYVIEYESPKGSGDWFVYFRRKGQKDVRMFDTPYSDPFNKQYHALLAGEVIETPEPPKQVEERTFAWLCYQYLGSIDFSDLDERTKHVRRQILNACINEPINQKATTTYGEVELARFTPKAVSVLLDRKAREGKPEAANSRLKAIRAVFKWAGNPEAGLVLTNPARDIQKRRSKNPDGFHAWTMEEVEAFEAKHPIGTRARLAMGLLLYTAQRRSDIVNLGRANEKDGWLTFTQVKNRRNNPVTLSIPIRPELREILDKSELGDIVYLHTEQGKPFTANGFGNRFREWCDQAGLKQCSAHGLRKAAATRLAENGATAHEIMAITGHKTMAEVQRYTRAAGQRRLAQSATARLAG